MTPFDLQAFVENYHILLQAAPTLLESTSKGFSFLTALRKFTSGESTHASVLLEEIKANQLTLISILKDWRGVGDNSSPPQVMMDLTHHLYCRHVAQLYTYADFKGIMHDGNPVSLQLDDIFVNLKAAYTDSVDGLPASSLPFDYAQSDDPSEPLSTDLRSMTHRLHRSDASLDIVLNAERHIVLLGGPGSGKSTLVKQLARMIALGNSRLGERFPHLTSVMFPVVIPVALFFEWRRTTVPEGTLFQYIEHHLRSIGGDALVHAFNQQWGFGSCAILLDGLDEIVTEDMRIASARAADSLISHAGPNKILVTSRIVGYSACRLSVPVGHFVLRPFTDDDITAFCDKWYVAFEHSLHPTAPRLHEARSNSEQLLSDIRSHERVHALCTNPLMLTIVALIRHKQVRLPQRRVDLYNIAIRTLIDSWNRARSLSGRPLGESQPDVSKTIKVWSQVAFWMHERTSRGAVRKERIHEELVRVLMSQFEHRQHEADQIADSYLAAASETSGLIEMRGADHIAFIHQTFQEYLAAHKMAVPTAKAVPQIQAKGLDPRWSEAIRLAAGIIGIQQQDDDALHDVFNELLAIDDRNTLYRILCNGLRLVASCISDDPGFRRSDITRAFRLLIQNTLQTLQPALLRSLLGALSKLIPFVDAEVYPEISVLHRHESAAVRRFVAEALRRVSGAEAEKVLEVLASDSRLFVQMEAMKSLWCRNNDIAIIKKMIVDSEYPSSFDKSEAVDELINQLLTLAKDGDSAVREAAVSYMPASYQGRRQWLEQMTRDPADNVITAAFSAIDSTADIADPSYLVGPILRDASYLLTDLIMMAKRAPGLPAVRSELEEACRVSEDDELIIEIAGALLEIDSTSATAISALKRITIDGRDDAVIDAIITMDGHGIECNKAAIHDRLLAGGNSKTILRIRKDMPSLDERSLREHALACLKSPDDIAVFMGWEVMRGFGMEDEARLAVLAKFNQIGVSNDDSRFSSMQVFQDAQLNREHAEQIKALIYSDVPDRVSFAEEILCWALPTREVVDLIAAEILGVCDPTTITWISSIGRGRVGEGSGEEEAAADVDSARQACPESVCAILASAVSLSANDAPAVKCARRVLFHWIWSVTDLGVQ